MRIAAIDQGTASTRVLIVEDDGEAQIRHAIRHRQFHPQPGWVEHDPHELLANVRTCIQAAGPANAAGIANQGESCLAWDGVTGEPLSQVIVWQDNRTGEMVDRLKAQGAAAITLERAGLPLDSYFSAPKFAWLLQHLPAVAAARKRGALRLGTTDAWFLDRLTGVFATDVTTASRTSLMNLATCQWDVELCRLFEVPIECLPEIRPTVGLFGEIDGVPITASIADQQAALYGHGCRCPGDAKITFGTGAFLLAVAGKEKPCTSENGLLPTVAWQIGAETVFAMDGGVHHAGSVIEWLKRLGLFTELSELGSFAESPAISRGLAFVPAFSGLASPHGDRSAAGMWIGLATDTSRRDLCQSALEGIALRTAEVVSAMSRQMTISDRLPVDGGLARSPWFTQFLADVCDRTIVVESLHEQTAVGCAALAALGLGHTAAIAQQHQTVYEPRRQEVQAWRARFADAVHRSKRWR